MTRFAIVQFPGSNCDSDCAHVVTRVLGAKAILVWHRDRMLPKVDCVIIPGGFSYGDYVRAGAIAKLSPIMQSVYDFAQKGGPILGICNGFQILLEAGLLPGAMQRNQSLKFICRETYLRCNSSSTPFTRHLTDGQTIRLPIAHAHGNYFIDSDGLARLQDNEQIILSYSDANGVVNNSTNPNGSVANIAAITNKSRTIVGMMPHPERAAESILAPKSPGAGFFSGIASGFNA